MKKYILIIFIILITISKLFSQDEIANAFNLSMQKSISLPSSPDVASLNKYGNVPISYYNGKVDISIPIYSIDLDGKKIPLQLVYNSEGIKVEEEASSVGLGWTLIAGGTITQIIKDKDDLENRYKYFVEFPAATSNTTEYNNKKLYHFDWSLYSYFNQTYPSVFDINYYTYYQDSYWYNLYNFWDISQDLFNINMSDLSGSFIIQQDNLSTTPNLYTSSMDINDNPIIILNKNNYNISFIWNGVSIKGIEILAEDGYKYIFDIIEGSFPKNLAPGINEGGKIASRTFYISKITSPLGNSVTFEYTTKNIPMSGLSLSQYKSIYFYNNIFNGARTVKPDLLDLDNDNFMHRYNENTNIKMLSKIKFDKGNIVFKESINDRLDLINGKSINEIIIDDGNQTIKKFILNYSYFESNESFAQIYNQNGTPSYLGKRLKLDAIQEIGYNNGVIELSSPPYRFQYYGNGFIPNRVNPGRDFWGYYNGKNQNTSLLAIEGFNEAMNSNSTPNYVKEFFVQNNFSTYFSNRSVDTNYVAYGTLNKIIYPLGGSSEFEYSVNRYLDDFGNIKFGGGLRIKKIRDLDNNGKIYNSRDYEYIGGLLLEPISLYKFSSGKKYTECLPTIGNCSMCDCYTFYYHDALIVTFYSDSKLGNNGLANGSPIGYDKVIEYFTNENISNDRKKRIEYEYEQHDCLHYDIEFDENPQENVVAEFRPTGIPYVKDWRNGSLKTKRVFEKNNLNPISEEIYQYDYLSLNEVKGPEYYRGISLDFNPTQPCGCQNSILLYSLNSSVNIYPISSGRYELISKDKIEYKDGKSVNLRTEYSYSEENGFLNNIKVSHPNGNEINFHKENIATSQDIYNENNDPYLRSPNFMSLYNQHIYTLPVKQTITKNGTLINGVEMAYNLMNNGKYMLSNVKSYNHNKNIYENLFTYSKYTTNGKVEQLYEKDNISISYLWGYNQSYPVAEFYNANVSDVSYLGFESNVNSSYYNMDNQNWGRINNLYSIETEGLNSNTLYINPHTGSQFYNMPETCEYGPSKVIFPSNPKGKYVFSGWINTAPDFPEGAISIVCQIVKNDTVLYRDMKYGSTNYKWAYVQLTVDLQDIDNVDKLIFWVWNFSVNTSTPRHVRIDDLLIYPQDARVQYLTYQNLIGQNSVTDPNSQSVFYEYDAFGRLQAVKNTEKDIMKFYKYEYNIDN